MGKDEGGMGREGGAEAVDVLQVKISRPGDVIDVSFEG